MHRSLDFLKVLAEHRRLHIVALLTRHEELTIAEMTGMLYLRQAEVAQALAQLRQARIVASRGDGRNARYYLSENRRELVQRIITALLRQFPLGYLPFDPGQAMHSI